MNLLRMIKEDEMKKISIILVLCSMLVFITGCGTEEPNKNSEVEVETESDKTEVPETTETETTETENTETETINIDISDEEETVKFLLGKKPNLQAEEERKIER